LPAKLENDEATPCVLPDRNAAREHCASGSRADSRRESNARAGSCSDGGAAKISAQTKDETKADTQTASSITGQVQQTSLDSKWSWFCGNVGWSC
jgi:hypothetical protein